MTRQLRTSSVFGLTMLITLASGRPRAMADVPPALDRVPTDAGVVIAIPNISKLQDAMKVLEDTFHIQADQTPMGEAMSLFETAGLKKDGSMAVAVMFPAAKPDMGGKKAPHDEKDDKKGADDKGADANGEKEDQEGKEADDKEGADQDGDEDMGAEDQGIAVMVVPVSDYKAFAQGLGGDPASAVAELHTGDKEMYAKDIGGGFAAVSDNKDALGTFSGKSGSMGAYKTLLGKAGTRLTETSDLVVMANIQVLGPRIKEGMASAQQYLAMAAMGQPNMAAAGGMMQALGDAVTKDGQAAMLGLDVEADGLRTEVAATFKEGSPAAGLLRTAGKASGLLANLPAATQGYLFAVAMDTTAPGLKKLVEAYADEATKAALADAEKDNWMSWLNKSEGTAGVIGTSPALMSGTGFFVNTALFAKSADPAGLIGQFRQSTADLNGKTKNNVGFASTYKAGTTTIAGAPVDEWQVVMTLDQNQAPAQAQMAMGMFFGPKGGPGGLVAPAKKGVVMTMSKNTPLMESALKAANGEGPNFASDPGVQAVAAKLPEGRTMEAYIGVKDILNMALPMAAMFGAGPIQIDVPADLPPIGIAGTSQDGAMRISSFVPTEVMKLFAALGEEMSHHNQPDNNDADDAGNAGDAQGGGRPRF